MVSLRVSERAAGSVAAVTEDLGAAVVRRYTTDAPFRRPGGSPDDGERARQAGVTQLPAIQAGAEIFQGDRALDRATEALVTARR